MTNSCSSFFMDWNIKLLFFLCICGSFITCKKQVSTLNDYMKYHAKVISAEDFISQKEFAEALEIYGHLSDRYQFVFLRDYKIAAQLALSLGEQKMAIEYIEKGIMNGWKLADLNSHEFLKSNINPDEWQRIKAQYDTYHANYLRRIDPDLRDSILSLFEKDQAMAMKAARIEDEAAQEVFIIEEFSGHSELQLRSIIKLIEQYGYPGEKTIGNNFWVSTILSHHNSIAKDYVLQDTLYDQIRPKLINSLKNGQISPYELAMIEDWKKAVISEQTETIYGYLNTPKLSNLSDVNLARKKIGLRSIELRNKLVELEQNTGMTFYLPDWVEGKINIEKE